MYGKKKIIEGKKTLEMNGRGEGKESKGSRI
jgi:hypothetical protein